MSARGPDGGSPTDKLWWMLLGGLFLQVAGFSTAIQQAPRTELTVEGVVEKGDRTVVLFALLGFGLGGVLSLIAVIAFGVLLGMRAHDRS